MAVSVRARARVVPQTKHARFVDSVQLGFDILQQQQAR